MTPTTYSMTGEPTMTPSLTQRKQSIRSSESNTNFLVRNPTLSVYLGRLAGHDTWASSPPSLAHRLNPMMSSVPNHPAPTYHEPTSHSTRQGTRHQRPIWVTCFGTHFRIFYWLLVVCPTNPVKGTNQSYPRFLRFGH